MNSTNSSASNSSCIEPIPTTETWVIFGVLLLLAFLSNLIVKFLFHGLAALIKVHAINHSMQKKLQHPIAFLVLIGFLELAFNIVFPWPCAWLGLEAFISIVLYILVLIGSFFLINRCFAVLETVVNIIDLPTLYRVPIVEGLSATKVIILGLVGIIFFIIVLDILFARSVDGSNLQLLEVNAITIALSFVLVPVIRDGFAGVNLLADSPFTLHDEVEMDGKRGEVVRIGLFTVVVKDKYTGFMRVIHSSRFLDTVYHIYSNAKKTQAKFACPLSSSADEVTNRELLWRVEAALQNRGYSNIHVYFEEELLAVEFEYNDAKPSDALDLHFAKLMVMDIVRLK